MISLSLFINFACTNNSSEKIDIQNVDSESNRIILKTENRFEDLFTFPVGTELWIQNNALNFILPEGYKLIFKSNTNIDKSYKVASISSGSVRCKCTEGKGCSPYTIGDQSGCSVEKESCKKCEMTTSSNPSLTPTRAVNNFKFVDAAIVNFNEEIEFLIDASDILNTPSPKGFIFDDAEIQDKIMKLISGYNTINDDVILSKNRANKLPKGYRYTPIKFSGKLLFVPLNISSSISAKLAEISLSDGEDGRSHSCTCHEGTGCTKGSTWTPKGTVRYCDAGNCTDCELTTN